MNLNKVGATVLIHNRCGSDLGEVTRETKTLWIVKRHVGTCEYRYRKSNLMEVGTSGWDNSSIKFLTEPEALSIANKFEIDKRKKDVVFQISKMTSSLIPDEDLKTYESLIYNYCEKNQ